MPDDKESKDENKQATQVNSPPPPPSNAKLTILTESFSVKDEKKDSK